VLIATVRTLLFARHADQLRRGLDAKLRTMFNLAPVAIAILDETFRYESVNPAYCALTGYSADELVGQPGDRFLVSESVRLDADITEHLKAGKHWSRRLRMIKKGGATAEVEWQIAEESISGVRILAATDITQKLRAEHARENLLASERAARSEAERSNRLKEEFLATLSHELRNPLNAILGWATLLSRKPDLPEPVAAGLRSIERNSRFQAQMIADLLDYAGITFGKMRLIVAGIDPYPVILAALDAVSGSAQAAGVELNASLGEEPVIIEADATRLQQIVWNLLSNAIKFSPRGGQVHVDARRSGDFLEMVVTDNGKGIEPEFLPRIFDRFSQQDATTTRSHGGLGLGLAIVKQLTELHGGSVHAASAGMGRGAKFAVTIPLSRNAATPASSDDHEDYAFDFSTVIALIVEDDDDARELTKRILADAGATVIEASSAEEAVARVASSKANILVSDIGMAHQDGYQLIRTLRAAGYGPDVLPAIALTAFARAEDRVEALAAGFQGHLVKPLDPQTLVSEVASLHRSAGMG
jgi:PAS domain S-box-containing protein